MRIICQGDLIEYQDMINLEYISKLWKNNPAKNAGNHPADAMQSFLKSQTPSPEQAIDECHYLAVDIETTGLSSNKDSILSIGFVPINRRCIDLSQAQHFYIETDASVGDSATIHHIKDSDLKEKGQPIEIALDALLEALSGKVLLVHYAKLDYTFLKKYTKQTYGTALECPMIDTLAIEKNRQQRENPNQVPKLRLDNCRQNYNLPRYSAHNALTDAIATAELWIAQMSKLQEKGSLKLKNCK